MSQFESSSSEIALKEQVEEKDNIRSFDQKVIAQEVLSGK